MSDFILFHFIAQQFYDHTLFETKQKVLITQFLIVTNLLK